MCEEMNKDNWNKKNPKNDDNDDEDYHYRLFGYSSLKYPEILTNMIIINTQSEYRKRNKKMVNLKWIYYHCCCWFVPHLIGHTHTNKVMISLRFFDHHHHHNNIESKIKAIFNHCPLSYIIFRKKNTKRKQIVHLYRNNNSSIWSTIFFLEQKFSIYTRLSCKRM